MRWWCCMGFILLAGNCLANVGVSNGNGEAGATWCNGKLCAEFASCVDGSCVCDQAPHNNGYGYSHCHTSNEVAAIIYGDPFILTLHNLKASLPIPCRYDVTQFDTRLLGPNYASSGDCFFHIKAFNRKHKGKFYLYGYDVTIHVQDNTTSIEISTTSRTTGVAQNGVYTYEFKSTAGLANVDGPYEEHNCNTAHPVTNESVVVCKIDLDNNVASIDIDDCGVGIKFRPYDTALGISQPMAPGLSVVVNRTHSPVFFKPATGASHSLALFPEFDPNYVVTADINPQNGSLTEKLVDKALTSTDVTQNTEDPNAQCTAARPILVACSELQSHLLYERCLWMLQTPKFIRCFDNSTNGQPILTLFNECAQTACEGFSLTQVQSNVTSSQCAPTDPSVKQFIALT